MNSDMERTTKLIFRDDGGHTSTVYVRFTDITNQPRVVTKVELGGDLLDVTDKLSNGERNRLTRTVNRR